MIPCKRSKEPKYFDKDVRQKGLDWLKTQSKSKRREPGWRPRSFWRCCTNDLAEAFADRCAYAAMLAPGGTVDHFISCHGDPTQAYEWNNYRYCYGWINACKQDSPGAVLDPFKVGKGWFRINLPGLQLELTDKVPADQRQLAQDTLDRLHLVNDERLMRWRRSSIVSTKSTRTRRTRFGCCGSGPRSWPRQSRNNKRQGRRARNDRPPTIA